MCTFQKYQKHVTFFLQTKTNLTKMISVEYYQVTVITVTSPFNSNSSPSSMGSKLIPK